MGVEDYKPIIVMVGCQFIYAGVTVSSRQAFLQDFSSRVFVVYRQCLAFLFVAPFAFFSRRRAEESCCLTWKSFWLIFLLYFIGVTLNHNLYYYGLYLSSSAAASAMSNLAPAIAFIMAYILVLEKVNLQRLRSIAKICGTVLCIIGAAGMAFLKVPKLLNMELIQPTNSILLQSVGSKDTWILGYLLLFASSCCWSLWLILQVNVTNCYPDAVSLTAWMSLMSAFQTGILTLIIQPDFNAWKVTSPFLAFCCLYAGFSSAVRVFAQAWCISRRGPLFSAMFNPLFTLIVTLFACIFVHEELYTGSIIGGLAVIIGLYIVLWGKAKDHQEVMEEDQTNGLVKQQINDQTSLYNTKVISSDCRINLEEPLLNEKSTDLGCEIR